MHIRNKGGMPYAAAAPMAVVTTPSNVASRSPTPALPGGHINESESLLF